MRSGLRIRPTWIERAFAFAGGCRTTYRIAESTAAAAASFAACSQLLLPPICGCCSPMYRSRNVAASSATGWMGRRSEGLATMSREGGADGRSQQEENWTGGGASAERSVAAQITRRSRGRRVQSKVERSQGAVHCHPTAQSTWHVPTRRWPVGWRGLVQLLL